MTETTVRHRRGLREALVSARAMPEPVEDEPLPALYAPSRSLVNEA